jgi:hypothetical protein
MNHSKLKYSTTFAIITSFFWVFIPLHSHALETIIFSLSPKYPKPNTEVTIRVDSFIFPIDGALISWYIDGQIIKSGAGEKALVFSTKGLGEQTVIKMSAVSSTGEIAEKSVTINPVDIDILWEADTYTPPFYKGKALPVAKSYVRLNTIPQVDPQGTNPSAYTPEWVLNKTKILVSGEKPFSLVPTSWEGSALDILLRLKNNSGLTLAETPVLIQNTSPLIRFYENHPLLGVIFSRIIYSKANNSGQYIVRGVPYYFASSDRENGQLKYSWTRNGKEVPLGLNPEEIVISDEGNNTIDYGVKNKNQILQEAQDTLTIVLTK